MTRDEFFQEFSARLGHIPKAEFEKSAQYYDEMIGDRMEDGMSESEAVAAMGTMDEVVDGVLRDLNMTALIKTQINDSKARATNKNLWVVLTIVGFPLWFPLLMAFFAVVIAMYVTVWSLIIALYAVVISLGLAAVCGVIAGVATCFVKNIPLGLCILGMALVCGGLMLLALKPMRFAVKGLIGFTKIAARGMKSLLIGKKATV